MRDKTSVRDDAAITWHALDLDEALRLLRADVNGLSSEEASRRRSRYGANALPAPPRRSALAIVAGQLLNPLIYLLLAAGAVAAAFGEFADATFILLVLAINSTIGALQEWRAETNMAALRSTIKAASLVLRDGKMHRVDNAVLVPGDIVQLEAGERVPADMRILRSADLQTDESSLTGESIPVDKAAGPGLAQATLLADRMTMLYAGSTVQRGRCHGIVVATGSMTELGRIAKVLGEPAIAPPLTRRLEQFTRILGLIAIALVAVFVIVQISGGVSPRETFFVAVALAVSIIPEGLPVAVTVALSIATHRMSRRNVIVRHLPAVEGLGACTVVATDKTGTLTLNQLTAKRLWLPEHGLIEVGGQGYDLQGEFVINGKFVSHHNSEGLRALALSSVLSSDADLNLGDGDTVDLGLLVLAAKAGINADDLRLHAPRQAEVPFAAERRYAASFNVHPDGHRLHVKGAPEVLLPLCRGDDHAEAADAVQQMTGDGFRVLAIATKELASGTLPAEVKALEAELQGLTLLGLVGFIDPLRPEAVDAIARCRRAGVQVKMITGDHPATALSIARQLGIADSSLDVMTGSEIDRLREEFGDARLHLAWATVLARVEPIQKVEIVEALKAAGHIVAMTGDGVNDAPALHRADLGVAMGRTGTDVAREAADLVLTDDNFASVIAGIEEGRAAYANIRKVVYLLISTGAAEVVVFLLAVLSGLPVPLTAIQLLWLNLVTNGGQDVALAFERGEPGLLDRPPRSPDEPIFDRLMIRQTAVSGLYIGLVAYGLFVWALMQGWSEFETRNLLLFLMVTFENVHVFNCRSETRSAFQSPLANNWPLIAAVIGAQAVHIGAAFTPGLRDVLQIAPISLEAWLTLIPMAASLLLVMELDKMLRRRIPTAVQSVVS
jgi:calcium-translocating P-type ATPase